MIENSGTANSVSVTQPDSCSDSEEDDAYDVQQLSDNYGSQTMDLPGFDVSNLATTVVKMKNSTNVEIKPTTQVTVHQYFQNSNHLESGGAIPTISECCDNELKKNETQVNGDSKSDVKLSSPKNKFHRVITSNISWKLGVCIILAVVIVVTVVVVTCVTLPKEDEAYEPTNPSGPEETEYDLGNDLHILTRNRWGGRRMRDGYQNRTLNHPIKLVIIGHTATPQCVALQACAQRLQTIQSYHVSDLGYIDIGYNFLVGGDGNIYQALGWDIRNYLKNNSIQIQFVGSYAFDDVLERQRMGLRALLKYGVKLGKLDEDYLLVAHNQVANTESPGRKLFEEIKLWPHYYNGTIT